MTPMQTIETPTAPARPELFSQATMHNGMIFVSGQLPMRLDGSLVGPGIEAQTDQVMRNIGAILQAGGVGYNDILKATVFLTDLADFGAFNKVYRGFFNDRLPARSTVQVSRLALDARIEIEVIATMPDPARLQGA